MPATREDCFSLEETKAMLSMLDELGRTLRGSFDSLAEEALPEEMGLLLLRLALAEVLKRAAEEEARELAMEALSVRLERFAAGGAAATAWAR